LYRFKYDVNQSELKRLLDEQGFPVSLSTINKYELGKRCPTLMFAYHVAKCLKLEDEQTNALFNAIMVDNINMWQQEFLEFLEFIETVEEREQRS